MRATSAALHEEMTRDFESVGQNTAVEITSPLTITIMGGGPQGTTEPGCIHCIAP